MKHSGAGLAALCCALSLGLAGCDRGTSASDGVRQTHFPGAVTAGGGTSGEVMARSVASAKSDEGRRGQAATPSGSVSGTPGIPEGAGGTVSGPAMGATTQGAAGTKAAPEPAQAPVPPAQKERQ